MKKYYFILVVVTFCNIVKGQTYSNPYPTSTKVEVEVKKNPYDFSSQFNQGIQAGAASRQASAAESAVYNEAMKDNYSKISIDSLINKTNNFEYVVVESVSGWMSKENKKDILNILNNAKKYQIIDISPDFKSNGNKIENGKVIPSNLIKNKKVLFVSWLREAQGDVNRITQFSIKNSNGNVIYESISKNLSYQEILKPLILNYVFTKETALEKVKEMKELLDLGVISKEEYDSKVLDLKPILLGNN